MDNAPIEIRGRVSSRIYSSTLMYKVVSKAYYTKSWGDFSSWDKRFFQSSISVRGLTLGIMALMGSMKRARPRHVALSEPYLRNMRTAYLNRVEPLGKVHGFFAISICLHRYQSLPKWRLCGGSSPNTKKSQAKAFQSDKQ